MCVFQRSAARILTCRSADGGDGMVHYLHPVVVVSLVISGNGHAPMTPNGSLTMPLLIAPKSILPAPVCESVVLLLSN